jgi:hypothetical protein
MSGLVSYGLVLPISVLAGKMPPAHQDASLFVDGFDVTELLHIGRVEDIEEAAIGVKTIDPETPFRKWINKWLRRLGVKIRKPQYLVDGWIPCAHKTDETRIENIPYLFDEKYQGTPIYVTEKEDGTSATFAIFKDVFYAASRNRVLYCKPLKKAVSELRSGKLYGDKYVDIACKYSLPKRMRGLKSKDIVIQG